MWRDGGGSLLLSLLFTEVLLSTGLSPPGKPILTSCRSPEKETFTCWWEPGSDGGLPTNYSLFYRKENSDVLYECPDYRTAGTNSCFFSKNDTSIWVNYNITVVATNTLGSNYSDPVEVDVVYIVQPHTPENVMVMVEEEDNPFLLVKWDPPHKADTRSGWITLVYQLRVRLQREDHWEEHFAGHQKQFNIFSLHSGEVYLVQVRCKPDHGFWSEWSDAVYAKVPDYMPRERSMWVLLSVFSAFIFLIFMWTIHIKRNSVKHFLLPPVPGPKIKGFDKQLLKQSGKSEEVFSALVSHSFLPASDYEDLLVEYLEVYENEEREMERDEKEPQDTDCDSGRGSCDSHMLLSEPKESQGQSQGQVAVTSSSEANKELAAGSGENPQVWSLVTSPHHHPIPEMQSPAHPQGYWEIPTESPNRKLGNKGVESAVSPQSRSMEYVEVQEVNPENALIVQPIPHQLHLEFTGLDYSKVNAVVSDSMLLLQRGSGQDRGTQQHCKAGEAAHRGVHMAPNGYVDTSAVLPSL